VHPAHLLYGPSKRFFIGPFDPGRQQEWLWAFDLPILRSRLSSGSAVIVTRKLSVILQCGHGRYMDYDVGYVTSSQPDACQ